MDVVGRVSLSVLEVLLCIAGRKLDRASAVSRLASSRVFIGLVGDGTPSTVVLNADGSILPMSDHLFLLGVLGKSVLNFGRALSAVSGNDSALSEE